MIVLGLAKISRLIGNSVLPWKAIHVAGTNGKGSVCAYISSMLHACAVPCGRFTSPHLIDKWDCITINEKVVERSLFQRVADQIQLKNDREKIRASEFELLTATAFEIFAKEKIKIGVVEVGLGGLLDATNVLRDPLVTVITKIGQDHETLLGNTLPAIASQKAGILKPGVPSVVDGSNPAEVLKVVQARSKEIEAGNLACIGERNGEAQSGLWDVLPRSQYQRHQQMNATLAYEATVIALERSGLSAEPSKLATAIQKTVWPGRLQTISLKSLTGRNEPVLLDGAHNAQSAAVLASYVDESMRTGGKPVTWLIATSKGKDRQGILSILLRPNDNLMTTGFGPVDGMPWVEAASPDDSLGQARMLTQLYESWSIPGDVRLALTRATKVSEEGPLVIAGSLYLVSEVLRLLRQSDRM
ncbi:folylpolyglutamate synthase [Lambiella insularis]|nr:folylpolyglutamate synthase [Lambiella insularis]